MKSALKTTCRHCRRKKPMRGHRGLCKGCHGDRSIRNLYPSRSRASYNPGGLGTGNTDPPPCPEPTPIRPGPAKVAVLAARAEAGVSLWHPRDTRGDEM